MAELVKSGTEEIPFRGYELLACCECSGEVFREESDPFGSRGERFKVYRGEGGMLWRTVRPAADLGPVTGPLVCCGCEETIRAESERHPAKEQRPLVVYDHVTGKQVPPSPPREAGR